MSWPISPQPIDARKNTIDNYDNKVKASEAATRLSNKSDNKKNKQNQKEKNKFEEVQEKAKQTYSKIERELGPTKSIQKTTTKVLKQEIVKKEKEEINQMNRKKAIENYQKQQEFKGTER